MAQEERDGSLSGLSESQAKEFHGIFVTSFIIFTAIAIVAHLLVWYWRPWLGPKASLIDHVQTAVLSIAHSLT